MLHRMDIQDNNNINNNNSSVPWNRAGYGMDSDLKNANRRLLEAQIHRDLGLVPPNTSSSSSFTPSSSTSSFPSSSSPFPLFPPDAYNPLQLLHHGIKQQQQQQQHKFVPS